MNNIDLIYLSEFNLPSLFPLRQQGLALTISPNLLVNNFLNKFRDFFFYIKDNQVLAAATSQRDTETAAITELMRLNQMPNPEILRQGNFDLVKHLHP